MADDKSKRQVLICFYLADDDKSKCALTVCRTMDAINAWKSETKSKLQGEVEEGSVEKGKNSDETSKKEIVNKSISSEIEELMNSYRESMSAFDPLVGFGLSMIPIANSVHIREQMYKDAVKSYKKVEEEEGYYTFEVPEDRYLELNRYVRVLEQQRKASEVLPGAILLSIVATFDSFIAETVRIVLKSNPKRYSGSDKNISIGDLLSMNSFDDAVEKVIDDEVGSLMRGSHEEQVRFIEKNFQISIIDYYERWPEFIEIFERRNLVAHGNLVVNRQYMQNCKKHGCDVSRLNIGDTLTIGRGYLKNCANILIEFGFLLMFVLRQRSAANETEQAYQHLSAMSYEFIKGGQSLVASRVLDFALHKQKCDVNDRLKKMMTINLANAYKKTDEVEKSNELIESVDWTAAADDFGICIASLRGEVEKFVELMAKVVESKQIRKSDFREWPVFDWVRDDERVQKRFFELFDEPMIRPEKSEEVLEESSVSDSDVESETEDNSVENSETTIH